MRTFLIILETLASLALTVVVLMQSGKEAGLSGALSGSSDSYLSKNKKGGLDQVLATSTKWICPAVFAILPDDFSGNWCYNKMANKIGVTQRYTI